jgi:hypothetical protein
MQKQLDKIEKDVEDIKKLLRDRDLEITNRVTRVETRQSGFMGISSIVFAAIITYLLNGFNIKG